MDEIAHRLEFLSRSWISEANRVATALRQHGGENNWSIALDLRSDLGEDGREFHVAVDEEAGLLWFHDTQLAGWDGEADCRLQMTRALAWALFVECDTTLAAQAAERGTLLYEGDLRAVMVFLRIAGKPNQQRFADAVREFTETFRPEPVEEPLGPALYPPTSATEVHESLKTAYAAVPKAAETIEHSILSGHTAGAQVCVLRADERLDIAAGFARATIAMTARSLLPWLCCTKLVGAVLFGQLWSDGVLSPTTTVASVIPEFGRHGKETLTFANLLSHSSGIVDDPIPWTLIDWESQINRIFDLEMPAAAKPGQTASYAIAWSWLVIAHAIARVSGRSFRGLADEEVIRRADLRDSFLGMSHDRIARERHRIGFLYDTSASQSMISFMSRESHLVSCSPHAGLMSTASDMATFVRRVLSEGSLVDQRTASRLVEPWRPSSYDTFYDETCSWGLGFASDGRLFGRHVSARAAGHIGLNSSFVVHDEHHQTTIAAVFNGLPTRRRATQRMKELVDALYEDLRLANA
jgi:CubicO group peptidase (beta-lactamase class C family)